LEIIGDFRFAEDCGDKQASGIGSKRRSEGFTAETAVSYIQALEGEQERGDGRYERQSKPGRL
jgi:hypothetical protein